MPAAAEKAVLGVLRTSTGWIPARVIASACQISARNVRDVVHRLVVDGGHDNLISRSGAGGGYKLSNNPQEIFECYRQQKALCDAIRARVRAYERAAGLSVDDAKERNTAQLALFSRG